MPLLVVAQPVSAQPSDTNLVRTCTPAPLLNNTDGNYYLQIPSSDPSEHYILSLYADSTATEAFVWISDLSALLSRDGQDFALYDYLFTVHNHTIIAHLSSTSGDYILRDSDLQTLLSTLASEIPVTDTGSPPSGQPSHW